MEPIVLIGAKNPTTCLMIRDFLEHNDRKYIHCFLDNDESKWGTEFCGYKVYGGTKDIPAMHIPEDAKFINLITGSTRARFEVSREIARQGYGFGNLIHSSVKLEDVEIGVGNYIQNDVEIQAGVKIGNNCSAHVGNIIAHETIIGDSVFVSFGVNIAGEVEIGDGVFVGAGATILPRIKIGQWATIGAGAVVTKDVRRYCVIAGNPARVIDHSYPHHDKGDPFR